MRVPGFSRREAVLAPHRNAPFGQGRERLGMQHLGAVIGQFGRFRVGDLGQHLGIRHQPRIGAHDAIHVGPDPKLGRVQRRRQDGGRIIRTAASQRGGPAVGGGAIEARHHRNRALADQRQQVGPRLLPRRLHQRGRVAEHGVGDNQLPGVHRRGGRAFGLQVLRHQQRREPLAHGHGFIHRARRPLVQHRHAAHDALEFADQGVNLRHRGSVPRLRQQLAAGVLMPRAQRRQVGFHARASARLGMAHGIEQQIGDLRHGRNHHRHGPPGALRRRPAAPPPSCAPPSRRSCPRTSLPVDSARHLLQAVRGQP